MKIFKRVLIISLALIFLMVGSVFFYVYSKLDSIYVKDEPKTTTSDKKEETEEDGKMVDGITNILLVGTDGANVEKGNRSDGTMVVTVDSPNKQIKLTSIARDTLVNIPGYGYEKMTHAYAYEGIDLLKEVFKVNFDLEIDKYVAVNFSSFMEVIDEIGGVEVDVPEGGLDDINSVINSCYEYYSDEKKETIEKEYLTEAGVQRLNGYQALAFTRIRYSDSAYHRDARHREVAESAYKEFLTKGPEEYKKCVDIMLDNTKTNISPMEMLDLGFTAFKIADTDIEQFEFPLEEHRKGHIINDQTGWVIEWEKEANLEAWHEFIFNE